MRSSPTGRRLVKAFSDRSAHRHRYTIWPGLAGLFFIRKGLAFPTMTTEDALYRDKVLVAAYDPLNRERRDFAFYRSQLPASQCRVLDVGCGTGALAIQLAELGHSITALDPEPEMIAFAKERPGAHQVSWIVGATANLPASLRFDVVIMTGHAFQCLLEDAHISAFFRDTTAALSPDGILVFETRNPAVRVFETWTPCNAAPPVPTGHNRTVQVFHEVLAVEDEIVKFRETYRFEPGGTEKTSVSRLRFAGKTLIARLADQAGLKSTDIFGDWDGCAVDENVSPELIFRMIPA